MQLSAVLQFENRLKTKKRRNTRARSEEEKPQRGDNRERERQLERNASTFSTFLRPANELILGKKII